MSKVPSVSILQIEEMKQLVVQGIHPHKIAERYNISPSTVHNYKSKFRNEGLVFADIKGGRVAAEKAPVTHVNQNNRTINQPSSQMTRTTPSNELVNSPVSVINQPVSTAANTRHPNGSGSTFVVNGTKIYINSEVKAINIDKTDGKLSFEITI